MCHNALMRKHSPASLIRGTHGLGLQRPTWRPYLYRGKQLLRLHIGEEIRAVQYDKHTIKDEFHIGGRIECEAALEGMPEVTIALTHMQGFKVCRCYYHQHRCC
jgi:AP-5 complex subunit mu-1